MINKLKENYSDNIEEYLENINIQDILKELPGDNECQLRVSVTQLCNESCFFCHNEWNEKTNINFDSNLFKKIIDVLIKYNIQQRIRFTWWEPLLYKWIDSLIKYIKQENENLSIWLTTNGLLLEDKAEWLISAWIDKITISLHSLDKKNYINITKVDGLEKVLNWLNKLKELWFTWEISINSVIWRNNIEEVNNLNTFAVSNWFKLKLLDILPITENLKSYSLTQREIEEITSINKIKWERSQDKCIDCNKKELCWWEAEYLRLSPNWVLNPCLWLKEFDINLKDVKWQGNFEKAVLLAFRRIKILDI